MSTVDNRVVEMNFDNTKFANGVQGTLSMLDRLKSALHLNGASQGLKDISTAAAGFNANPMVDSVGRIGGAFTAMQTVAFGALANIGAKLSETALNTVKAFTIAPITAGFNEYELKMGSIQTILANTSRHGTKLEDVNHSLEELNKYADQTIYNFGDMTRNIGLFTNAGLKLEESTTMIKGFSNAAAASGTNAEQAAHAAQQLSQGLSAGKITAQDWMSLTNAQMGNKNMQESLIGIADAMGTFSGTGTTATKATNGFKGSLEKGWLTADVMSTYLQAMSGDMSDAEIAALGLSDAQEKMLKDQAKMGLEAATKVRTFSGLMSTLKESVGSGWAESFGIVLGDFDQATELFTNINNVVGGALGEMGKRRNELLTAWADDGGRKAAISGLSAGFKALFAVASPVIKAFRDIFPATSSDQLVHATVVFRDFMRSLMPSTETVENLRRTFAGLFAILGIGWEILKAGVGFITDLLGVLFKGDSGFLKTTASIGDFLVGLHKAIKEGEGLKAFFDKIIDTIEPFVAKIKKAGSFLGDIFGGVDVGSAGESIGQFITGLLTFGDATESAGEAAGNARSALESFFDFFLNIGRRVADFVAPLGDIIGDAIGGIDYDQLMQGLQTGALAGIALFIKQLGGMFKGFSLFQNDMGFIDKIKDGLDNLTGTLGAMQANLKASMLLKIAAAIALLAISVVLLAGVDAQGLMRATAALTVMFIQLGVAMNVFQRIGTVASMVKLNLMGAALILVAAAVLILAAALRVLARMSWSEIARGMAALAGIITVLIIASRGIDKQRGAILRSAASLVILGFAIQNLVKPIKQLGTMDWNVLKQGLIGVGGLLAGLALFTRLASANKGGLAQSVGIFILAMALKDLGKAVEVFGTIPVKTLERGFAAIGTGLTIMAIALRLMPKSPMVILTALALSKVAGSLVEMAMAFKKMEDISWDSIKKGLVAMTGIFLLITAAIAVGKRVNPIQALALGVVASAIATLGFTLIKLGDMDLDSIGRGLLALGGTLAILATAIRIMGDGPTLAGAVALIAIAYGLSVLVPVITTLGNTPLGVIAIGLGALAAVFVVLGVAAWALAPAVPVLQGLGIAMLMIGGAMALAGIGLALFSVGLTALAAAGTAGVAALVAIVSGLIGLIPMVAEQIGKGIVALLVAIGNSGAELTRAFVQIMTALLNGIIQLAPKLGQTLLVLIQTGLRVIVTAIPMFVNAGFQLLFAILQGIANNIGRIVSVAADIGINFINALAQKLPAIIQAGINFIISFVNGLADGIRNNSRAMGEAGGNLATAMVEGMINGLGGLVGKLIDAAKDMARRAWEAAKEWLGIASPSKKFAELGAWTGKGFIQGLNGTQKDVRAAIAKMVGEAGKASEDAAKRAAKARADIARVDAARAKNMQAQRDVWADIRKKEAKGQDTTALRRRERDLSNQLRDLNKQVQGHHNALAKANAEYKKSQKVRHMMNTSLMDERKRIDSLAKQYDAYTKKIEDANEKLAEAKKIRDDYKESVADQYDDLPEFEKDTKLTDYVAGLEKQIIDTQLFTTAMVELRKLGLNDDMYKELIAKGPEAMPFIQQILAGGKGQVDQLNTLNSALNRDADKIAATASTALYQAGVKAAEGLVAGLKAKQKAIDTQMSQIANYMAKEIKKALGIKSPSRVFAELGRQTNAGLVNGLNETASAVGDSAAAVGDNAISSLKDSLSNVSKIVGTDMDASPVISPVLDLSNVRRDASGLAALLAAEPLTVDSSYSGASNASSGYRRNQEALITEDVSEPGDTIVFEQHNHSPKALTNAEIYRQTNNQLSRAKGALVK